MIDPDEDLYLEKVSLGCCLLVSCTMELLLHICNKAPCCLHFDYRSSVVHDIGCDPNVIEVGNSIVDQKVLGDMGVKHAKVVLLWLGSRAAEP